MTAPHELPRAKEVKRSVLSPQVGAVHGKTAWNSLRLARSLPLARGPRRPAGSNYDYFQWGQRRLTGFLWVILPFMVLESCKTIPENTKQSQQFLLEAF